MGLRALDAVEQSPGIGQATRDRDGAEVEELGRDGGVALEAVDEDPGVDGLEPPEGVAPLQEGEDGLRG